MIHHHHVIKKGVTFNVSYVPKVQYNLIKENKYFVKIVNKMSGIQGSPSENIETCNFFN